MKGLKRLLENDKEVADDLKKVETNL